MVAAGLFSQDPMTGAKRLGGHDPQHAQKVLAFAKVMARPVQGMACEWHAMHSK